MTQIKKVQPLYIKGCVWKEKYNDIPNALIAYKEAETCISRYEKRGIMLPTFIAVWDIL